VSHPPSSDGNTLEAGTVVGEYRVTHKLGEGGMGVVYAGQHPEIGKQVAIKVLSPVAAAYPDLIRRFKEEARSVNKIRHPNIIDIFAFNQLPDGRHYFVMEYLEGESLTARLERGAMELPEMRRLLGQICSALEAAHQAGVVHRDLKPDNIWVATQTLSESRIKLLDFGIAKLNDVPTSTRTQAGVSMGTPHYMPPEQGMGKVIDARADIYALGVVLYQIFAGVLPFDGTTAHEIVFKHVTEAPVPPSRHRPIAPPGMEQIILDCLKKEPSQRPASAKELGARIDAVFVAEEARARAGGPGATTPWVTAPFAAAARLPTQASSPPAAVPASGRAALAGAARPSTGVEPAGEGVGMTSLSGMAADLADDVRPPRSRRPLLVTAGVGAIAVAAIAGVFLTRKSEPPAVATASAERPPAAAPSTPAPAAAAPVAAVSPPPKAAPATVKIKIDTEPSGARIVNEADGSVVGQTPFDEDRPQGDTTLAWKLELDGFKSRAVAIPLRVSFEGKYPLEKRSEPSAPPTHRAGGHDHKPASRAAPPAASVAPPPAAVTPPPAATRPAAHKKAAEIEWQ
jgi:serine/threonine-protein kinase